MCFKDVTVFRDYNESVMDVAVCRVADDSFVKVAFFTAFDDSFADVVIFKSQGTNSDRLSLTLCSRDILLKLFP